jgi:hypothetical protein
MVSYIFCLFWICLNCVIIPVLRFWKSGNRNPVTRRTFLVVPAFLGCLYMVEGADGHCQLYGSSVCITKRHFCFAAKNNFLFILCLVSTWIMTYYVYELALLPRLSWLFCVELFILISRLDITLRVFGYSYRIYLVIRHFLKVRLQNCEKDYYFHRAAD